MANDDVCNGSDFQHMLLDAYKIKAQLLAALEVLLLHPATPLRNTLRADANGLITRFCAFRQREVARLVVMMGISQKSRRHIYGETTDDFGLLETGKSESVTLTQ